MKLTVYNLVWKMYYSSRRRLYQWKTKICNNWYKTLCSTLFSTLSAQDNEKLFQQLKKGFKRTINLNKYQSEPKIYTQNRYLNHLIDTSFQGVSGLFVLSFENDEHRRSYKQSFKASKSFFKWFSANTKLPKTQLHKIG